MKSLTRIVVILEMVFSMISIVHKYNKVNDNMQFIHTIL